MKMINYLLNAYLKKQLKNGYKFEIHIQSHDYKIWYIFCYLQKVVNLFSKWLMECLHIKF